MDIRGVYMFSSLMKQNKKAKICFVICFAGKKKILFYIYAVIVKQKFYKRSSKYYPLVRRAGRDHSSGISGSPWRERDIERSWSSSSALIRLASSRSRPQCSPSFLPAHRFQRVGCSQAKLQLTQARDGLE
jgi:hypothetical protein